MKERASSQAFRGSRVTREHILAEQHGLDPLDPILAVLFPVN